MIKNRGYNLNKFKNNNSKNAVSEMVAYVIFISIILGLIASVYSYLSYVAVAIKPSVDCNEGTKVLLNSYSCDSVNGIINLTIKNNGRFNVNGIIAKFSDNLSKAPVTMLKPNYDGVTSPPSETTGFFSFASLSPDSSQDAKFFAILNDSSEYVASDNTVKMVDIQPFVEEKEKIVCIGTVIREKLDNPICKIKGTIPIPRTCNDVCDSLIGCEGGYVCYNGNCRDSNCLANSNCVCTTTCPPGSCSRGEGIVVDNFGNTFITGWSNGRYLTIKYNASGNQSWEKQYYGFISAGQAYGIALDSKRNVYVTGLGYDPTVPVTDIDIVTVKYNENGTKLWSETFGNNANYEEAHDIAIDSSGNVYITGLKSAMNIIYCQTLKYDNNWNDEVWEDKTPNLLLNKAEPKNSSCQGIAVDNKQNIYLAGMASLHNSYDFIIIKSDSIGNEVWNKSYDYGRTDRAEDIALDSSGNIYATGRFENVSRGFRSDFLTVKLDNNGNEIWKREYNNNNPNSECEPYGLSVDQFGNVYVAGTASVLDNNFTIIKYDSNGNLIWVKSSDGGLGLDDYAYGIIADDNGFIYITGEGNGNHKDFLTIKYDSSGNEIWRRIHD